MKLTVVLTAPPFVRTCSNCERRIDILKFKDDIRDPKMEAAAPMFADTDRHPIKYYCAPCAAKIMRKQDEEKEQGKEGGCKGN